MCDVLLYFNKETIYFYIDYTRSKKGSTSQAQHRVQLTKDTDTDYDMKTLQIIYNFW